MARKAMAVEPPAQSDSSESANGIRAMRVGLSLLKAFAAQGEAMKLKDASTVSGLSGSRTHRYLASMIDAGFIVQDAATGNYDLGPVIVELGLKALGRLDYLKIAQDELDKLVTETGLDGHIAVWGSEGPTVVHWRPGRAGYQIRIQEGRVLPLLGSATGRLFLANRKAEETAPIVSRELAAIHETNPDVAADIDANVLDAVCEFIRLEGVSFSIGSLPDERFLPFDAVVRRFDTLGFSTVAAPIHDRLGTNVATITLFGGGRGRIGPGHPIAARVREHAREASRKLGWYQIDE
ncbi:IclR family transcriptional regulator [Novosphingobium sp.]|uniref:IclR family transcriptional regulator n=1 Tax=Novosphingobium sp. TaxID=1874826 RepID=UPI002FE00C7E